MFTPVPIGFVCELKVYERICATGFQWQKPIRMSLIFSSVYQKFIDSDENHIELGWIALYILFREGRSLDKIR